MYVFFNHDMLAYIIIFVNLWNKRECLLMIVYDV